MNLDYPEGTMGPMYGYQWNHFGYPYQGPDHDYTNKGFNQLNYCIDLLKNDPYNRRIMMTTYDPSIAHQGVLFPCHSIIIQFYVEGNKLSMSCYNRSQDLYLGTNFNTTSSSLLIYLLCEIINQDSDYHGPTLVPGRLIMNLGDCHIYEDHRSMVIRQILRDPYPFPTIKINSKNKLTDYQFEDFEIDYQSYPNIPAKMIA
jgi:thymidylate synthase